jgi:hypothetical protein
MTTIALTSLKVLRVFFACRLRLAEATTTKPIDVKCVDLKVSFHPDRLEQHRAEIITMIDQALQPTAPVWGAHLGLFAFSSNNERWTARLSDVEQLIALGMAIGYCCWLDPEKQHDSMSRVLVGQPAIDSLAAVRHG